MNWLKWLLAGPSEVERLEVELIAARAEIVSLKKETAALNSKADKGRWLAFEPAQGDECTKTRLHTIDEAREFRIKIATHYNVSPTEYGIYRCRICPRHPATGNRFLHLGNIHKKTSLEKKLLAVDAKRARAGVRIQDSVSPADIAKLRERFK